MIITVSNQFQSRPPPAFIKVQRNLPEMAVYMAIEYVKTRDAAERIYFAEVHGLNRKKVVERASRRMDDFSKCRIPEMEATFTTV